MERLEKLKVEFADKLFEFETLRIKETELQKQLQEIRSKIKGLSPEENIKK